MVYKASFRLARNTEKACLKMANLKKKIIKKTKLAEWAVYTFNLVLKRQRQADLSEFQSSLVNN